MSAMAFAPRPFDTKTVLSVNDGRAQAVRTDIHRPGKVKTYTITVPAGKSRLLVMDDRVLSPTNPPVYLRLASSVEGVSAWPIDSLSPDVGSDMRFFGWLFDWTAPAFTHDHGNFSTVGSNHATGTGSQVMHAGTFPCFQDYEEDVASPVGNHALYFKQKSGPAFDVRAYDSQGMCVSDHSTDQSGGQNERRFHLLLGPTGYYDLGVERDGLGFTVLAYAEDAALMTGYPVFAFYSYPYIDGILDLSIIPTVTPAGDTVWDPADRNLCRRNIVPGSVITGWDPFIAAAPPGFTNVSGPGFKQLITPPLPVACLDGLNSLWYDKSDAGTTASGAPCPVVGDPTWRRITMISGGWAGAIAAADSNAHLVNVFFGPAPGRWYELRPFAYVTTDNLWSQPNRPALGFQNPTSLDATIEVEYGAAA